MAELIKGDALGDIVKYESPMHICREEYEVTRVLAAVEGLQVGRGMDFDAAVAAVQTYTTEDAGVGPPTGPLTWIADGGTYRLGYKGHWTGILAWNANVAAVNAALDILVVLSGGVAGDIVFANVGGDLLIATNTFTFLNTLGNVPDVIVDARLLTDATYAAPDNDGHGHVAITTTTAGELATMKMVTANTANVDCILLEEVSLAELQNSSGEALRRPFLVRGHAVVNATAMYAQMVASAAGVGASTLAQLITALLALGITGREESAFTDEGTPRS